MAARHAVQIIRGRPSTSESAGTVASLPTPGAFPALARRDWPSSETPCVAKLEYFCSSDSWQGGRGYVAFTVAQINACIETCGGNTGNVTVCKATLLTMTPCETWTDQL